MTTREAFEKWAVEAGHLVERIAYDPDNFSSGQYKSILTNARWNAWRAATNAAFSAPATAPATTPATTPERKPMPILEINARWEQSVLGITPLQYYQVIRETEAFHDIKGTP